MSLELPKGQPWNLLSDARCSTCQRPSSESSIEAETAAGRARQRPATRPDERRAGAAEGSGAREAGAQVRQRDPAQGVGAFRPGGARPAPHVALGPATRTACSGPSSSLSTKVAGIDKRCRPGSSDVVGKTRQPLQLVPWPRSFFRGSGSCGSGTARPSGYRDTRASGARGALGRGSTPGSRWPSCLSSVQRNRSASRRGSRSRRSRGGWGAAIARHFSARMRCRSLTT